MTVSKALRITVLAMVVVAGQAFMGANFESLVFEAHICAPHVAGRKTADGSPSLGLSQASLGSGVYAVRSHTPLHLRMQGGAWGKEPEVAKASLELLQIRFEKVDVAAMKTWLQKWPKGTSKDGFGMPKTMLPVGNELSGTGVRINWKGSDDPWMQIDLEGDTVRVFRQSMLQGSFLHISALKEREEKKICEKLKEDLKKSSFSSGMIERELPKMIKKEEKTAEKETAETAETDITATPKENCQEGS